MVDFTSGEGAWIKEALTYQKRGQAKSEIVKNNPNICENAIVILGSLNLKKNERKIVKKRFKIVLMTSVIYTGQYSMVGKYF